MIVTQWVMLICVIVALILLAALSVTLWLRSRPTPDRPPRPVEPERVYRIWHPLRDHPITVTLSREQLQLIGEVLRGDLSTSREGWRLYLADRIDTVVIDSLEDEE